MYAQLWGQRECLWGRFEQQPWNNTKQIFPEQKTKKFFALRHLCPVHEVLSGIWNPLIPEQIVNLLQNIANNNSGYVLDQDQTETNITKLL